MPDTPIPFVSSEVETPAGAYPVPAHGWTCFHCGETFTTPGSARDHFGFDPSADPACRIKLGAERGLLMALRKAEADIAELQRLLHDENSEAWRLLARDQSRHACQLAAAEEAGYERGLTDGRMEGAALPWRPMSPLSAGQGSKRYIGFIWKLFAPRNAAGGGDA